MKAAKSNHVERAVRRAIKTLDAAYDAMGPLASDHNGDGSRVRLRSDIREYLEYLERATWWRKSP